MYKSNLIAASSAIALCLSTAALAQQAPANAGGETAPKETTTPKDATTPGASTSDAGKAASDKGMAPSDKGMAPSDKGMAPSDGGMATSGAGAATTGTAAINPVTEQKTSQFMAEKLLGSNVYNEADESIGSVEDLAVGDSGKIESVVVSVGGFLGIGSKQVGLTWDSLQREKLDGEMILRASATTEQLKEMPEFRSVEEQKAEAAAEQTRQSASQATGVTPSAQPE